MDLSVSDSLRPADRRFVPGLPATHAVSFSSSCLKVSFSRDTEIVRDLRIEVTDPGGVLLGTIAFAAMSGEETRRIVAELLAIGDETLPHPADPVTGLHLLRSALGAAEKLGIGFRTDLGGSAVDAAATAADRVLDAMPESVHRDLMQIRELGPGIFHVYVPSQYLLTSLFLRFQEHFESPAFATKIFGREEFKQWYRREKGEGKFSYYEDWTGFNIPDYVLEPFRDGRFQDLTPRERAFVSAFSGVPRPFYIIGTSEDDAGEALNHEIAHAMFHTNPEYRAEVLKVLEAVDSSPIINFLKIGYHERSWVDEVHAYLLDGPDYLSTKGVRGENFEEPHRKLIEIFERHWSRARFTEPRELSAAEG